VSANWSVSADTYRWQRTEFAGVLEKLESKFYEEALSKFQDQDFTSAGYSSSQLAIQQIQIIQSDEQAHSEFIEVRIFYS
jgi:hypothetical protein